MICKYNTLYTRPMSQQKKPPCVLFCSHLTIIMRQMFDYFSRWLQGEWHCLFGSDVTQPMSHALTGYGLAKIVMTIRIKSHITISFSCALTDVSCEDENYNHHQSKSYPFIFFSLQHRYKSTTFPHLHENKLHMKGHTTTHLQISITDGDFAAPKMSFPSNKHCL